MQAPAVAWGAAPYRVLFGDSPDPLTETITSGPTFDPGPLVPGQTYYWQVFDSTDANLVPGGDGVVRLLAGQDLKLFLDGLIGLIFIPEVSDDWQIISARSVARLRQSPTGSVPCYAGPLETSSDQ